MPSVTKTGHVDESTVVPTTADITFQSGSELVMDAGAKATLRGVRMTSQTSSAITGATTLTLADAGGIFEIDQDAAFDIALPDPSSGPGCRYTFVITDAGSNAVTISTTGSSTFVGTIANDVTSVLPATGSTLTFVSGTAAVGDTIEAVSISTTLYLIRAISSAAGGITIA